MVGDVLFVGAGLLTEVVLHGVQAVQVSSLPTLPTALSLWRSGGFPSGVSRLFY